MYQFKIIEVEDGGYRFELGAIKIYVDGFNRKDELHFLKTPRKAIGYFNIDGNIYGISNDPLNVVTVEAFYDSMNSQYSMFSKKDNNSLRHTA